MCASGRCVLQAVRGKRGAAAKDVIPDESFLRLRGALFFGPGFHVTRNKLTFRDNLQELLTNAISGARVLRSNLIPRMHVSMAEKW